MNTDAFLCVSVVECLCVCVKSEMDSKTKTPDYYMISNIYIWIIILCYMTGILPGHIQLELTLYIQKLRKEVFLLAGIEMQ